MSVGISIPVRVLVAGAVGAAAALLFTSKRGEKMRSEVGKWTRDTEHDVATKIREVGSDVADVTVKAGKRLGKASEAAAREFDRVAEER